MKVSYPWQCASLVASLVGACSAGPGASSSTSATDSPGTRSNDAGLGALDGAAEDDAQGPTPTAHCADGVLTKDEACDDGNRVEGDGCASTCKAVEPGFSCPHPGAPCHRVARCGDAVVVLPELCDDGDGESGDGCSDTCKVEVGSKCAGEPSVCTPTLCGDGEQEGAESCDDGNAQPFDGCSASCQKEPDCSLGACRSECGDGLVLPPEECDDGNLLQGDGCSPECAKEEGFLCSEESACEKIGGECVLRVAAVFRDFKESHPDFSTGCDGLQTAVVKPSLDGNGRPELIDQAAANRNCITSPASFLSWYADGPEARTIVGDIVLFDNGRGGYVNRLDAEGNRFIAPSAQPVSDQPCATPGVGCVPCRYVPNQSCSVVESDGNPLFFPINDAANAWNDARFAAKVPEQYGANGWPWATDWTYWPDGFTPSTRNNFSFTSEVKYWYLYDPDRPARLDFAGDDDVWVFVNGKLAVDLGGVHVPLEGSVTIDATSGAGRFGMERGQVYPVTIFHAERKQEGSSFKLTLSGFNASRSDCRAICGDGVVGLGEECDDGENAGGYGECASGCKFGPYCGDGIVQAQEDCDHGLETVHGCGVSTDCRAIVLL